MREVFVGRHAELARLESAYAAAVDGRSQVVVLVGAAGVGKTALLRRFGSTLPLPVLAASGDEMEARLPFGVIGQVYAAAGQDAGDHLVPREPLTVGSALLDLVGPLQERGTVVIAIDDAHWSDQPSLQALAFALRRLRVDRALAILTLRSGEDHRLPASLRKVLTGDNATRIELDGLGIDEVRHLSIAIGAGAMSRRAATRIVDQTDGTPLYVKALLPHVTDLWSTSSRPIVAPPSFMQLTQAKLASCEPESRRLVEALAVVGTRAPLSSVVELAHLDDVTSSLDCAVAAGLVVEHTTPQMAVEFDHPLIRSAVYHGLRPAARSALHEGAAALAADPVDALRHRLAAALSPDVDLATSARSAATRLASEGSYERAAELLLEAARISRSSDERAAALLEAVELLVMGGSISEAAALRRQLLPLPASAHRSFVLARVAFVEGKGAESDRLLQDAWHLRHADDPGLVRKIAEQLGAICLVRGDAEDAVNWARRAIAASADPPDPQSGIVDTLSLALVIGGRVGEAMSATSHLDDMDLPNAADGLVGRGIAHLWRGDLSLAARTLRAASSRDRSGRPFLPWGLIGLTSLAEVEYLAGFWDDAITHSQLAVSIARDTEQDWIAAFAEAVAAWPLAGRGEHERARQHIDAGLQHIDESSVASGIIWLATAEALLGAARGDWASVLEAVAPLQRMDIADVVGQPGWGLWRHLMIEGLVHVGELEQADRELRSYQQAVRESGATWACPSLLRIEAGLLRARGRRADAMATFEAAMVAEGANPDERPLEAALLRLDYGEALTDQGAADAATAELQSAGALLARLGAEPYVERCSSQLRRLGRRPRRRRGTSPSLTPQETAVAHLVERGCTNREIAAELFVSVKTVEYHLGNAYAKAGVSSRTQLIRVMREDPQDTVSIENQGFP